MKFQTDINAKTHDDFVKESPLNHLLQSSKWASVKDNWSSRIVGVVDNDGKLIASALVLIKRLPLGFTMLYTPRGPILDYTNQALVEFFFNQLKSWGKTQRALFIKFDPAVILKTSRAQETATTNSKALEIIKHLEALGAEHLGFNLKMSETIQPRFQANERLAADMDSVYPKHAKRLMKDAMKRDVKSFRGSVEDLPAFNQVVSKTEARKGVALRNGDYFKRLMDLYGEDAYLHLAQINLKEKHDSLNAQLVQIEEDIVNTPENQKKRFMRLRDQKASVEKFLEEFELLDYTSTQPTVIAGILSIKFGTTIEMLYAGMDDDFKKFYPQYLLYPQVFNDAYEADCLWGNMGGVEGTLDDGLFYFKKNFNPDIQELIGEFNLPVNRLLYRLSDFAYKLRKKGSHH
ncbi:MAG: aminoacyltransferase [Streptococcaceae bacterium]|nr:aminoacyltransferase [Streptococcaceae bacterium]